MLLKFLVRFSRYGRPHRGFENFESLTADTVKRANLRHLPNFMAISQTVAEK